MPAFAEAREQLFISRSEMATFPDGPCPIGLSAFRDHTDGRDAVTVGFDPSPFGDDFGFGSCLPGPGDPHPFPEILFLLILRVTDSPPVSRLEEIGRWMDVNGAAIHGTRPIAPYKEE